MLEDASAWGAALGRGGYAKQWWGGRGALIAAEGIHGQFIAVDRGQQLVVAAFSSWPTADDEPARAAQYALVAELAAVS